MTPAKRTLPWLIALGVILVGLNLRAPLVAIAPVIGQIGHDLGLGAAQAGLLTSLPVLCFALATPLASLLIARGGPELATTVTLFGVILGTIVRSAGGIPVTIAGTLILGIFITIGNVVMPVIIQAGVPAKQVGLVTGAYTSALNVGSMITSIATAPLAQLVGWRVALLCWAGLAVVAIAVWLVAVGPRAALRWSGRGSRPDGEPIEVTALEAGGVLPVAAPARVWRSGTAIALSLAFAGQAFSYYGLTAWLPALLADEQGYSLSQAGSSSSIFQVSAVVGALGVPLVLRRLGLVRTFGIVAALWCTIPLGLILAPQLSSLWSFTGGAAQGGGITIVFMIVVSLAGDRTHARRLSAMVQGVGYALAALAPTIVGAVHEASGGWTAPLLVLAGALSVFIGCGLWAARRAARRETAGGAAA